MNPNKSAMHMSRRIFFKRLTKWLSVLSLTLFGGALSSFYKSITPKRKSIRLNISQIETDLTQFPHFFIQKNNNELDVLSRRCPHLGCTLHLAAGGNGFLCPCHGSRFSKEGKYQSGPANKDMERYRFNFTDNQHIEIQL